VHLPASCIRIIDFLTQQEVDFSRTPISAIFIFHDPRNWSLDVQIICDVLQSGGTIGDPHISSNDHTNGPTVGSGKPIELIFCNPDLLWKNEFDSPRLGQGAFKASFLAVYKVHCAMRMHRGRLIELVWTTGVDRIDISVCAIRETDCRDIQVCGEGLG
jgi:hypothetical protein